MKIDKWYHLYGTKDAVVFEEVDKNEKEMAQQTDLITKIQNGIKASDANDVYSCGVRNGLRWCISLIDDKAPLYEKFQSAQPVMKKGEWMHDKDDDLISGYCSCCGWESVICEEDVAGMPYCPNCGAYMRGEEDD